MEIVKINETQVVEQLSASEYIIVVLADGSLGRIRKDKIVPNVGCYYLNTNWETKGWHRIAINRGSSSMYSSAIINIGNSYYNNAPNFACFFIGCSGYSDKILNSIGKSGALFSKVRVSAKAAPGENIYIDVYYNNTTRNGIYIAMSSCIGLTPYAIDDSIATVPEGYSFQEFDL